MIDTRSYATKMNECIKRDQDRLVDKIKADRVSYMQKYNEN